MKENEGEEILGVNEAKAYYDQLEKAHCHVPGAPGRARLGL